MNASVAICSMSAKFGLVPSRLAPMSRRSSSSTSFSLKILTALIGSPMYFGLRKRAVLTRRPRSSQRLGMMRLRSIARDRDEVLQDGHAELVALFGMELRAEDVAEADRGGESIPV